MDRKKTCEEIEELFIKLANKYHSLEKIPVDYGVGKDLYHSERHLIEKIGDYPEKNITELAKFFGVLKGQSHKQSRSLRIKGLLPGIKERKTKRKFFLSLQKQASQFTGNIKTPARKRSCRFTRNLKNTQMIKCISWLICLNGLISF